MKSRTNDGKAAGRWNKEIEGWNQIEISFSAIVEAADVRREILQAGRSANKENSIEVLKRLHQAKLQRNSSCCFIDNSWFCFTPVTHGLFLVSFPFFPPFLAKNNASSSIEHVDSACMFLLQIARVLLPKRLTREHVPGK